MVAADGKHPLPTCSVLEPARRAFPEVFLCAGCISSDVIYVGGNIGIRFIWKENNYAALSTCPAFLAS